MTKARDNSKFGNFAGNEVFLDSDKDTSITADTDDQIDIKTGGTDRVHIDSSGNVGIGTSSPDGKLHIETASSGATANTNADELVLEGTGNMGMSFLTSTTGANRIYFGDSGNALSGVIKYDHNIDAMDFSINGSERMRINSSGNVGIGTLSPDGKLHVETASSGATADTNADELVLEGTGNMGMSFLTSTTGANRIYFGDSDDPVSGAIKYDNNNDNMNIDTNGLERIRIDSSGNVGIGTSSPSGKLTVSDTGEDNALYVLGGIKQDDGPGNPWYLGKGILGSTGSEFLIGNGSSELLRIEQSGNVEVLNGNFTIDKSSTPNLLFRISDTEKAYIRVNTNDLEFNCSSGSTLFRAGGTEYERITPAGYHLFGSTGVGSTSEDNMQISSTGGNITMYQHTTALQGVIDFRNPNGFIGSIRTTGSSTQFNTSSDYRLKENVNYTFDATTELKRLKPCKFNFIADADTTLEGFLAHEVADVVPHAVSGEKDATKQEEIYDENSNVIGTETVPDYQQIDQSKLVPLLVKTIQELEARITALENN